MNKIKENEESKIESILLIGKNGSGKTTYFDNFLKEHKKKHKNKGKRIDNNIIYIPTEEKYQEELASEKSSSEGNYIYKIKVLMQKIWGNLNKFDIDVENDKLLKETIKNIEGREEFKTKIKDFFSKMKNNDEHFIFKNESILIDTKKFKTLELNIIDKNLIPSGLNNYSIIKLLSELLKFSKKEYKEVNNLDQYYLLIDEPEKFCHPQLIKKIALHLKKINEHINLIVSTHSEIFFNWFINEEKTEIKILRKKEKSESFTWKELKDKFISIIIEEEGNAKRRELESCITNQIMRSQIINSLFSERIILVEGFADELLLNLIIEDKDFSIVRVLGKFYFIYFLKLFKYLNFKEKNIFIIYDKDKNLIDYSETEIRNRITRESKNLEEKIKNEIEKSKNNKENHININRKIEDNFKDNIIYSFNFNLEKDFKKSLEEIIKDKKITIKDKKNANLWIYEYYEEIKKSPIYEDITKKIECIVQEN